MKKIKSWILVILSILTVMLPAAALWSVEQWELNTIEIALGEGELSTMRTGEYIASTDYRGNTSEIDFLFDSLGYLPAQYTYPGLYNDTIYAHPPTFREVFLNDTDYIGNSTFAVHSTYVIPPSAQWVFHWLNVTNYDLLDIDALLINNSFPNHREWGIFIVFPTIAGSSFLDLPANKLGLVLNNGSHVLPISSRTKFLINQFQDTRVWFYYGGSAGFQINTSALIYDFSVEILETNDILFAEPIVLFGVILAFILFVEIIFMIFQTDLFDIKIYTGIKPDEP
jgi:hypothetical protein